MAAETVGDITRQRGAKRCTDADRGTHYPLSEVEMAGSAHDVGDDTRDHSPSVAAKIPSSNCAATTTDGSLVKANTAQLIDNATKHSKRRGRRPQLCAVRAVESGPRQSKTKLAAKSMRHERSQRRGEALLKSPGRSRGHSED